MSRSVQAHDYSSFHIIPCPDARLPGNNLNSKFQISNDSGKSKKAAANGSTVYQPGTQSGLHHSHFANLTSGLISCNKSLKTNRRRVIKTLLKDKQRKRTSVWRTKWEPERTQPVTEAEKITEDLNFKLKFKRRDL